MYSEKLMEHFRNPRNGREMPDADAIGTMGNSADGDTTEIYIKVRENKIVDISFQTYGCAAAIAISSMLTELAKGKTLEEAEKITRQDVADSLGGLPPRKMECSNIAPDALRDAIKKYRGNSRVGAV